MSEAANDNTGASKPAIGRKCPICGKPASTETRPFCSKRCADVDLHRWLGEGYRLPVVGDGDREVGPEGE